MLAVVVVEGLLAGNVVWTVRCTRVGGRPIVVDNAYVVMAFAVFSIASFTWMLGVLGIRVLTVRILTKKEP